MRKYIKEQCIEALKILDEAFWEIKRNLDSADQTAALQLLGDCQESAVTVGNMIEEAEGEGTKVVSLLEEYCEQLWSFSQDINNLADISRYEKKEIDKVI